jgi:hypothetical protein
MAATDLSEIGEGAHQFRKTQQLRLVGRRRLGGRRRRGFGRGGRFGGILLGAWPPERRGAHNDDEPEAPPERPHRRASTILAARARMSLSPGVVAKSPSRSGSIQIVESVSSLRRGSPAVHKATKEAIT